MEQFGKFGFYHKGEELLIGGHLQDRGIVISEMIIGSLPQIRVGLGDNFNSVPGNGAASRLPGPPQATDIKFHVGTLLMFQIDSEL